MAGSGPDRASRLKRLDGARHLLVVFVGLFTVDAVVAYLQYHYHQYIDFGVVVIGAVLLGAVYAAVVDEVKSRK